MVGAGSNANVRFAFLQHDLNANKFANWKMSTRVKRKIKVFVIRIRSVERVNLIEIAWVDLIQFAEHWKLFRGISENARNEVNSWGSKSFASCLIFILSTQPIWHNFLSAFIYHVVIALKNWLALRIWSANVASSNGAKVSYSSPFLCFLSTLSLHRNSITAQCLREKTIWKGCRKVTKERENRRRWWRGKSFEFSQQSSSKSFPCLSRNNLWRGVCRCSRTSTCSSSSCFWAIIHSGPRLHLVISTRASLWIYRTTR